MEKEGILREGMVIVVEVNCLYCCEARALVKLWNCLMG